MFTRLRSFLNKHRKKFVISGVVVASAYVLSKYVRKCLNDWNEKQAKEFLERRQKQQHYESIERACNQAALNLIPSIKESVCNINCTESLIKSAKIESNKAAIFEELKYLAFSKITLLVYLSSLLVVTLRLQLNLIGGYMFKNTIDKEATVISNSIQEKYLSISHHLLKTSIHELSCIIRQKVEMVLKNRSLKEKLTLNDVEQIFWSIHAAIRNDQFNPCNQLTSLILPPEHSTTHEPESTVYCKILSETRDLLESEEVMSLTNSSVSRGFSFFVDSVAEYFVDESEVTKRTAPHGTPTSSGRDPFFNENLDQIHTKGLSHISKPMAKVIPIISGLISNRESIKDSSSTWIQQLILMDNLKIFGANVYECFSI